MKPKISDSCPVCPSQLFQTDEYPDSQANISWIRCDICRQWYHSVCVKLTESQLKQISLYHCSRCESDHGPSHMKRQLKRARVNIDYVALDQGETFAVDKSVHPHVPNFHGFEPYVDIADTNQGFVAVLESHELDKSYVYSTGLSKPVVVPNASAASGIKLPQLRESITVDYVAEATGGKAHVEVMDVLSQQSELPAWTMSQWKTYFYTPESERDRIRNVISLEVSHVENLGTDFVRPKMVSDLDLVDKVWCDSDGNDQKRPPVTVYCLMSVRGSYTDFHIDFSGTPVYYMVCQGAKTFLMYPPTPDNLELYERWCLEPQQNFTWFAEYTKRLKGKNLRPTGGFKISLNPGDLFIIPSGWIHSVYTPEDAVIIGGNHLTLRDLPMHLTIYEIEKRTHVPSKYRFPMFNKVLWLTSWYYLNHKNEFLDDMGCFVTPRNTTPNSQLATVSHRSLKEQLVALPPNESETISKLEESLESSNSSFMKDLGVEKDELPSFKVDEASIYRNHASKCDTSHARSVLEALISHLKQHYEISLSQPIAKKSIPTQLFGRNVKAYFAELDSWLQGL